MKSDLTYDVTALGRRLAITIEDEAARLLSYHFRSDTVGCDDRSRWPKRGSVNVSTRSRLYLGGEGLGTLACVGVGRLDGDLSAAPTRSIVSPPNDSL